MLSWNDEKDETDDGGTVALINISYLTRHNATNEDGFFALHHAGLNIVALAEIP